MVNSAQAIDPEQLALSIALEHLQQGRLDAARTVLQDILARDPRHGGALNGLATEAAARGDEKRAMAMLENALAVDVNDGMAVANLAALHATVGRWEEAAICLERAEGILGPTPALLGLRAQLLAAAGDGEAALEIAQALVAEAPDNAENHYRLGVHLLGLDRPEAAAAAFRATIALQPQHRDAWHNLGQLLSNAGEHEEALAALRRALLMRPGEPVGAAALSQALLRAGQPEAAEAEARRALVAAPNQPLPLIALGRALSAQGRHKDSLASLARAVRATPDHPLPLIALADALSLAGQDGRAADAARQALARAAGDPGLSLRVAELLLRQSCYAEAWEVLPEVKLPALLPLPVSLPQEQGEALRFARLLPVAGASGLPVVAYGARSLAGILASSGVAVAQSDAPPESVPLARLAGYLRPDPKQLSLPSLLPEPTQRARWEKALEGRPRPVIAIACGGGAGEPDLAGLLAALGTGGTLLSLLIGPPRGHIGMYPSLLDGGAHVQDLDDLGAALAAADYVVVGEGVTGHLAGNLGLQGAVLLPPIADWCWGPRNADGLWYQGLTACRAEAARGMPDWTDWAPALAALAVLAADWQARSGTLEQRPC